MDPMEAIKQTYFQECDELLLAMEEGLIAIEAGEADGETVNAVFRAVHSIKGGGGAFGFEALVAFAHIFETVLDHLRSGKLDPNGAALKVLLRAGDVLSDHVAAARGGHELPSGHDADIKAELAMLSGEEAGGEEPAPADFDGLDFTPMRIAVDLDESAPPKGWTIVFKPHPALYAKANEPFLLIRELAQLGEAKVEADLSALPVLDALEPDQAYLTWTVALTADVAREKVEEVFDFVVGDCDLSIEPLVPPPAAPAEPQSPADGVEEIPAVAAAAPVVEKKDAVAHDAASRRSASISTRSTASSISSESW
jgi:two-component system chemotaxis sensor kinase CheA